MTDMSGFSQTPMEQQISGSALSNLNVMDSNSNTPYGNMNISLPKTIDKGVKVGTQEQLSNARQLNEFLGISYASLKEKEKQSKINQEKDEKTWQTGMLFSKLKPEEMVTSEVSRAITSATGLNIKDALAMRESFQKQNLQSTPDWLKGISDAVSKILESPLENTRHMISDVSNFAGDVAGATGKFINDTVQSQEINKGKGKDFFTAATNLIGDLGSKYVETGTEIARGMIESNTDKDNPMYGIPFGGLARTEVVADKKLKEKLKDYDVSDTMINKKTGNSVTKTKSGYLDTITGEVVNGDNLLKRATEQTTVSDKFYNKNTNNPVLKTDKGYIDSITGETLKEKDLETYKSGDGQLGNDRMMEFTYQDESGKVITLVDTVSNLSKLGPQKKYYPSTDISTYEAKLVAKQQADLNNFLSLSKDFEESNDFKIYKDLNTTIKSARAQGIDAKTSATAAESFRRTIAMLYNKGALSEADVTAWGGSLGAVDTVNRNVTKFATGKMTEKDRIGLLKVLETREKILHDDIRNYYNGKIKLSKTLGIEENKYKEIANISIEKFNIVNGLSPDKQYVIMMDGRKIPVKEAIKKGIIENG
jgi:hypothetical protein